MAELREIPLPEHLARMPEFRLLDEVGDRQISDFMDEVQKRHDDLLITTATETGIARRERILGILPDPEASLESRRATVLFWWYNRMPYSRRVLESKVAALCGPGKYTFDYDVDEETLHVGIDYGLGWDVVATVQRLLDRLVMLNVILDVRAIAGEQLNCARYLGAAERVYARTDTLNDNASDIPVRKQGIWLGAAERAYARTEALADNAAEIPLMKKAIFAGAEIRPQFRRHEPFRDDVHTIPETIHGKYAGAVMRTEACPQAYEDDLWTLPVNGNGKFFASVVWRQGKSEVHKDMEKEGKT